MSFIVFVVIIGSAVAIVVMIIGTTTTDNSQANALIPIVGIALGAAIVAIMYKRYVIDKEND